MVTQEKKKTKKKGGFALKFMIAVVGSTLTALILLKTPPWGTCILASVLAALMGYEMTVSTKKVGSLLAKVCAVIFAAGVPWAVYFHIALVQFSIGMFALIALLFFAAILSENGPTVEDILYTAAAASVFPLLVSLLPEILRMENGTKLVVIPMIVAWCSDGGAQILGMLIGKRRLIPRISPGKTVAGFFGGILGAVIGMGFYAAILSLRGVSANLWSFLFLALIGSLVSVLGDLSLSLVKRSCGIKDFGCLLPEHGGVLDRFDSVSFVLPFCYLAFMHLPLFK